MPLEDLNKGVTCSVFMFLKVISVSELRVDGIKEKSRSKEIS